MFSDKKTLLIKIWLNPGYSMHLGGNRRWVPLLEARAAQEKIKINSVRA